jgi:NodT family efflux transporter outer membrane factor (OMF) lipoprotein
MKARAAFAVLVMLALIGCMVGPKYVKPDTSMAPAFKEAPPDSFKETKDWKYAQPGAPALPAEWWEIFQDPQLTALEKEAIAGNQNIKIAEARFRQARVLIRFNRASEFPTISTAPGIASLRDSANRPYFRLSPTPTGDFVLPFDLSYELDFWGRVRRTVNASREEAQASSADLAAATLGIQAELAYDYFELRAADAQAQLLQDTVKAYSDALQLTKNRFEGGAAPKSDVAQAQTQLETTLAQLTDIGVQRAQYEHAIATLVGRPPAALSLVAGQFRPEPPPIPVGVPSQLLERRPDVAAAERRVQEANEQIGIARAAFFPTVTLGASVGFEGSSILNWLNWPSRFWAVGPSLVQTLFDAGRRRAGSDAAIAAYDAAVAVYRENTLGAFQQVEDNLAALRILETEERQQRDAVASARESLQIFINRYQGGVDNYLQVITAQTITLNNERTEIDIQRRRMDASVLLVKALGGGWSVTSLPTMPLLRKG